MSTSKGVTIISSNLETTEASESAKQTVKELKEQDPETSEALLALEESTICMSQKG